MSPGLTTVAGLAPSRLTFTWPARQPSVAAVRVLYTRTAHSHLSTRAPGRLSWPACVPAPAASPTSLTAQWPGAASLSLRDLLEPVGHVCGVRPSEAEPLLPQRALADRGPASKRGGALLTRPPGALHAADGTGRSRGR